MFYARPTPPPLRSDPDGYLRVSEREPVEILDDAGRTVMTLSHPTANDVDRVHVLTRTLSPDDLAAVDVPTPEQIRAALRRATAHLRRLRSRQPRRPHRAHPDEPHRRARDPSRARIGIVLAIGAALAVRVAIVVWLRGRFT